MMPTHWFFWIFLVAFVFHEASSFLLTYLNLSNIKKNRDRIPPFYLGKVSTEQYEKSIRYTVEKTRFGLWMGMVHILLVWVVIIFGVLSSLDGWLTKLVTQETLTYSVVYCLIVALILITLKIPVTLYSNFVIEERHGFNKMTYKVFIGDFLKTLLLGSLLGIPLLYLVFWLFQKSGNHWWIWAFFAVFGFEFILATVYPALLAPLFNKFVPLPNGPLKEAILSLAKKVRFKLSGIYTIDGSRRSAHSNAYFSGIGRFRRIVLFDTLMKQLTDDEVVAVLAHEMGHNIKRHNQKNLVLAGLTSFTGFWILSTVIDWSPFYETFGAGEPAVHKAFVILALFSGYFTFLLTPLMNFISRRYEYQADRFSFEVTGDKGRIATALIKLTRENLSNLTPHPLFSFFHYNHPTTFERVQALEGRTD